MYINTEKKKFSSSGIYKTITLHRVVGSVSFEKAKTRVIRHQPLGVVAMPIFKHPFLFWVRLK